MRKLTLMFTLILFLTPFASQAKTHQMLFPLNGCLDHNIEANQYNCPSYELAKLVLTEPNQPELLVEPQYFTDSNGESMLLVLVKNGWRYTIKVRNVDNPQHVWFGLCIYMRPNGNEDFESLIQLIDTGFDGHCDSADLHLEVVPGQPPKRIMYNYPARGFGDARNMAYEGYCQEKMDAIVRHLLTIWYD